MQTNNVKLNTSFHNIVDCFSGSDGGVSFVNLQKMIEELNIMSENGDHNATKILEVVYQFSKLIDISNNT